MLIAKGLPAWDDGAATPAPKALTTSFVAGRWLTYPSAAKALLTVVLSGDAETSVEVQATFSENGGTTVKGVLPALNYVASGVVSQEDAVFTRLGGAAGKILTYWINLFEGHSYRFDLKRTGGAAGSEAIATVSLADAL